jgi:membrane-bound lytic murein transglycosylase B
MIASDDDTATHDRVAAEDEECALPMSRGSRARPVVSALAVACVLIPTGCSAAEPRDAPTSAAAPTAAAPPAAASVTARPLAADPAQIADDLATDERALRDPGTPDAVLSAAARRQQAAYRVLGRHPEWDAIARPRIPPDLLAGYDHNIDARRQLAAMARPRATLPAWRIVAPRPADELMGYYQEAEAAFGVNWNVLAAINFVETAFGRVAGVSTAGAQGPMQFMPSTFAAYGAGGDILAPRDAIMAAGRYLAANGFTRDRDHALYRYNNSLQYVRAINDYAAVLAADPAGLRAYHRWGVYVNTTAGDVLLPDDYAAAAPIPVEDYLSRVTKASSAVRLSPGSSAVLDAALGVARETSVANPAERAERLSRQFLGTPYGADTLVGSATVPEQLVAELERVDCFTLVDYVEALKRSTSRDQFVNALIRVRYKDNAVGFATRKHFFTDWAATGPAVATDITATLSRNTVEVAKNLNRKDSGGVYLPGLPVVPRTVAYLPSAAVDDGVVTQLRTGDYLGAYAEDGGLDVTHVGIYVDGPTGPVLRNASSLSANQKVVDSPLFDYLRTVPGIVVLRPVQ